MKRYFVLGIVMIASLALGTSASISAMQRQTGATEAHAKMSPKKKRKGVERAGADVRRGTERTSKAVGKSGSKTVKAVGKSSKAVAKGSAQATAVGGKTVAKGAKKTAEAPAKLVRKVEHTSKRRSN